MDDDRQETSRGTLPVRRHARWYEIGGAGRARWIVLHGYAQRAERFLRRFRAIAGPERQIVAPEGLSRFYTDDRYQRVGASWMTRDDRELEITDTLDWLDALIAHLDARDGAPARTTVLGFSQGAHTAGRWAALRGARIDRLICWGSGLPQDVDLDRFATAPYDLEFVVGTEDPLVPAPALAREFERVREAGIAFGITEFEGGHTIDPATLQRLVSS